MPTLNLGILAHVDAGKTTLTERLLYDAGVIATLGSVDAGSTHTDFLPLERQRGITIRSAVVSFALGDTTVNLIDTPGHPDFIAEVERALVVLDAVVLVISAVEGVQPQTRILMRALQRLRVPTILFVNKIDRGGARYDDLLEEITRRLRVDVTPMSTVESIGTRAARAVPRSPRGPVAQPVFFGSAITGAGVDALMEGITQLLPPAPRGDTQHLSARVFKIERGRAGEKVSYLRAFAGELRVRQRVPLSDGRQNKVTAIEVFRDGATTKRDRVAPGEIAKVWGLTDVRVGDVIGEPPGRPAAHFGPPTLESVITAVDAADGIALRTALSQLAEQDPLINVRYDDEHHELSVSLYGEVQKEVIEATLAADYGIAVTFGDTHTVYVERPVGTAEAFELLVDDDNPTSATMGLRVEPAAPGSGVVFRLAVDGRTLPTYIYKSSDAFVDAMTLYLRDAFREGLYGWEVTDCCVTMTRSGYYIGDGPTKPTRPTMRTTAKDFRKLTPLVAFAALSQSGTVVCGPRMRVHLECPVECAGNVVAALLRLGGAPEAQHRGVEQATIEGTLPSDQVQALRRDLTRLTSGEGTLEAVFAGYDPVVGKPPTRRRRTPNPLNRKSYFLATMRHRKSRSGEYT